MRPELIFETCATLPKVTEQRRRSILDGPTDRDTHAHLCHEIEPLRLTELALPSSAPAPGDAVRVVFWNAERGRHLDAAAALLAEQGAAVNLVCELDLGMARSAQRHTARDLAAQLGHGYAFAVEFLELGLGDRHEQAQHTGEENAHGLHGSAILSPHVFTRPALIRLEREGHWFDDSRGERRVGGRIAQVATLEIAGRAVAFAVVHFESHSDPQHRAGQMAALLQAIERYAPGAPAIIGGDFNTASASREDIKRPGGLDRLLAEDPDRLLRPMPYEPLFDLAGAAGYDWSGCNDDRPTQRPRADEPAHALGRIDWFFARGLNVSDPDTIPAVDRDGRPISDHDALAVTIAPAA